MVMYRVANKNDFESIAKLHAKSWQENYRDTFSEDFLNNQVHSDRMVVWKNRLLEKQKEQSVILAEEKGQLIGFICTYFEHDNRYGTLLDNLHVTAKAKGKGIGTSLINRAVSTINKKEPTKGLYLWVLDSNAHAINFYEGLGGVMVEKVEGTDIGDQSFFKLRFYWDNIPSLLALLESKKKTNEC